MHVSAVGAGRLAPPPAALTSRRRAGPSVSAAQSPCGARPSALPPRPLRQPPRPSLCRGAETRGGVVASQRPCVWKRRRGSGGRWGGWRRRGGASSGGTGGTLSNQSRAAAASSTCLAPRRLSSSPSFPTQSTQGPRSFRWSRNT
ncbi:hypothetical protein BS78_01G338100 [Paspalum vaginatum]|nr:hypothetical protein BS78_01G338100 [Paspalum vaginatum]